MSRIFFLTFAIWFLILPFSAISSIYFRVAGLAVDKVMAPMLIFIWLGLLLAGKYSLCKKKLLLLIYVFVFFMMRNISFIDDATVFTEFIWRDAIVFGYFALPVLYIDNLKRVDFASKLISVNAVVGCVSAFLVAFSILELPYDRFSESRIGFESIRKSIGVITAYGDVTQLAAFFLLLGLFMPDKILPTGKKMTRKFIKLSVLLIIIMGLIGNQSRSYLLSLIFAYGVALFFSYRSKRTANTLLVDVMAILGIVIMIPLMLFILSDIVSSLAGLGGKEAMGSAGARLGQYEMAFSLIRENPIFGVNSEFYIRNGDFAHGVHNLWLGQLTRGGIASTLILLILMINVFRQCVSLFKIDNAVNYAKVLIGYLAAVFLSTLFYPADTDIFWALLGMCTAIIYTLTSLKTNKSDKVAISNIDGQVKEKAQEKRILRRAR